jgi:hypothetical protein
LRQRRVLAAAAAVAITAAHGLALGKVHTCTDPVTHSRTLSQLPCPEATGPTPAEVLATTKREQEDAIAAELKRAAANVDRQLLLKYPEEGIQRKAHGEELQGVFRNLRSAAARFAELVAKRKPLDDEAAFYKGRPLPLALQRSIDGSEASFDALTDVFRGLRSEVADIETRRGLELERLRGLWAGAAPGSMGLLASASASSVGR